MEGGRDWESRRCYVMMVVGYKEVIGARNSRLLHQDTSFPMGRETVML